MNADLFSEQDLEDAVDRLATMKFPFSPESRGAVMRELVAMCPTRTSLLWLVNEAVAHVPSWPGLAELRGILCSRYDPADGRNQYSTLAGYRAEDGETKSIERNAELNSAPVSAEARRLLAAAVVKTKTLR